jgi:hypothetical protein
MSAYQLNKLLHNLKDADKVKEVLENHADIMERYRLSAAEIHALEAEDLAALYTLGANPYMIRNVYRKKYQY